MGMPQAKWKDEHLATIYRLARAGYSDVKIQEALGIAHRTWQAWCKRRPQVRVMLEQGRKREEGEFYEYVHERLPAELQARWEHLIASEKLTLDLHRLDGLAVRQQQALYLHALVHHNFIPSRARRTCGLTKEKVERWAREDPGFRKLEEEVHEAKKDYFEWALMDLVARRETAAVIFANKTYNRDRGYNERVQVDVKSDDRHALEELGTLSVEQKRLLLEAIEQAARPKLDVIDVEAR